ncbi:MAG: hypothetical protein ACP5EP_12130 [Acidobacteriaceae bacterium]
MSLLPLDFFLQLVKLLDGTMDLLQHLFALDGRDLDCVLAPMPGGPLRHGHHGLQVLEQFGGGLVGADLLLCLEKQLWLFEHPAPDLGRGPTPGGIQLPGLTAAARVLGQGLRHALAVLRMGARHGHQKLHGHMGRYFALAHLLLHALRQQLDQGQPPRHPAHTVVHPAC